MENTSSNAPLLEKVGVLSGCLLLSYMLIRQIWGSLKMGKDPIVVLLTGAAGEVSYALVPMIARGITFGSDQPIILHLLDIEPQFDALRQVEMELQDSAFPLLRDVIVTSDIVEACKDVNYAILLGGTERKDDDVQTDQLGEALGQHAAEDCRVVVVATNPSSKANLLVLKESISSSNNNNNIPAKNITCLSRLDHNRALSLISNRLDVAVNDVKNLIIWGNHSSSSSTQLYPDVNHAIVATTTGQKKIAEAEDDHSWLDNDFITAVQQRGAALLRAAGRNSPALSTATAISDHLHDWVLGTPKGEWVSMGVCSDGSYGIQPGLFYSFPVTCTNGHWKIVQGLQISEFSRKKMDMLE